MKSHKVSERGHLPISALKQSYFPIHLTGFWNVLMALLGKAGSVMQTCQSDSDQDERVGGAVFSLARRCRAHCRWRLDSA
jgi:hypothetical protein